MHTTPSLGHSSVVDQVLNNLDPTYLGLLHKATNSETTNGLN